MLSVFFRRTKLISVVIFLNNTPSWTLSYLFKFYHSWRNKLHVSSFVNLCRVFDLSSRGMQRSMDSFSTSLTISAFYWHLIAYIFWVFSTVLFSRAVTFYTVFEPCVPLIIFYPVGQYLLFVRFSKFCVAWLSLTPGVTRFLTSLRFLTFLTVANT